MDGTLIEDNIGLTFVKYLLRKRKVSLIRSLQIVVIYVLYKAGVLDFSYAIKSGSWALTGSSVSEIDAYAQSCFDEEIKSKVFTDGVDEIFRQKSQGAIIVIATGAHSSIAERLKDHLKADHCVATRSETQDGRYGSRSLLPLPYKEGKKDKVQELIKDKYPKSKIIIYTDEQKDIPLLSIGDELFAVNADKETTDYVRNRGGTTVAFK